MFFPEETAEGISKKERFLDTFVSTFLETVMQSLYLGLFKEIFSTYERNKDYSCDFLKIINNSYKDYCNKKFGKWI